jgi:hypothetical protein
MRYLESFDDVTTVFSELRRTNVVLSAISRNTEFSIKLAVPDEWNGALKEVLVHMSGETIDDYASLYAFSYGLAARTNQIDAVSALLNNKVVDFTKVISKGGTKVSNYFRELLDAESVEKLWGTKVIMLGNVTQRNFSALDTAEPTLRRPNYKYYETFNTNTAELDLGLEEDRKTYNKELNLLFSSGVKEGVDVKDQANWQLTPVFGFKL